MRKRNVLAASVLAVGMVMTAGNYALARTSSPDKPGKAEPIVTDATAGAPPAGFASWAELLTVQESLDAKAEKIMAAKDAGFAGIEIAPERRAMTVYWKGAPSSAAQAGMDAMRGGAERVELRDAQYSEAELMAEADRVIHEDGVTAVSPKADGSGLNVSYAPGHLAVPLLSPIPLTTDEAQPIAASRNNDSPPYWGGAKWRSPDGGCSTGFAISIGGKSKMLSAGHCAKNGAATTDGGGDAMGTVSGDDNSHDRLYINTSSGGRVYNGGPGSGEYSNPVIGASRSVVGDYICSSGAYSGTRCNSRVVATNQTINIGYLVYETVRAEQQDRQAAIGNGDSGGPSFGVASDNTKVIAKGTHTAIDGSTARPCTGEPTSVGRTCAWRFWYVDVTRSLSAYNAKIVTG